MATDEFTCGNIVEVRKNGWTMRNKCGEKVKLFGGVDTVAVCFKCGARYTLDSKTMEDLTE